MEIASLLHTASAGLTPSMGLFSSISQALLPMAAVPFGVEADAVADAPVHSQATFAEALSKYLTSTEHLARTDGSLTESLTTEPSGNPPVDAPTHDADESASDDPGFDPISMKESSTLEKDLAIQLPRHIDRQAREPTPTDEVFIAVTVASPPTADAIQDPDVRRRIDPQTTGGSALRVPLSLASHTRRPNLISASPANTIAVADSAQAAAEPPANPLNPPIAESSKRTARAESFTHTAMRLDATNHRAPPFRGLAAGPRPGDVDGRPRGPVKFDTATRDTGHIEFSAPLEMNIDREPANTPVLSTPNQGPSGEEQSGIVAPANAREFSREAAVDQAKITPDASVDLGTEPTNPILTSAKDVSETPAVRSDARVPTSKTVPEQLAEHIVSARRDDHDGSTRIEVTLDPPELGRVRIQIAEANDLLSAKVLVAEPATLQSIKAQLPSLLESLAGAGLSMDDFQFGQFNDAHTDSSPSGGHAPYYSRQSRPDPAADLAEPAVHSPGGSADGVNIVV